MKALAEVSNRPDTPVRGIYRIVSAERRQRTHNGQPVVRLTIADASDSRICGFYMSDASTQLDALHPGSLVAVEGRVARTRRARSYVRLSRCTPVTAGDRPNWHLLPIVHVPEAARSAFTRLRGILNRLTVPALRDFMHRILGDSELAERFVQSAGLSSSGGDDPGRLLIDSVARAEKAERIAFKLLDRRSAELVIVGSLLRDIGVTFENGEYRSLADESIEAMNLYVLDAHFSALELVSRECALAIHEMLMPESAVEMTGSEGRTLCADLVRWLDKLDTGDQIFHSHTIRTSSGETLARVALPCR